MVMLQRRSEDEKVTSTDVYATSPNIWVPMVTILGHNSLDRAFPNIQALGGAQCGIPGRYFLRVLPLLIKMEFEVHDQLFHGWSKVFSLKRHSDDLTVGVKRRDGRRYPYQSVQG